MGCCIFCTISPPLLLLLLLLLVLLLVVFVFVFVSGSEGCCTSYHANLVVVVVFVVEDGRTSFRDFVEYLPEKGL